MLEAFVALKHMHGEGYVHSDMKPEQVLLSAKENGIAKVGDLGFTCRDGTRGVAGSPIFLAPELIKSKRRTYSVDMWAMGVSLYTLTNNGMEPPFLRGITSIQKL